MTAFLMGNNPETALKSYTHQLPLPEILPVIPLNIPNDCCRLSKKSENNTDLCQGGGYKDSGGHEGISR
jgi:hypothetical protein